MSQGTNIADQINFIDWNLGANKKPAWEGVQVQSTVDLEKGFELAQEAALNTSLPASGWKLVVKHHQMDCQLTPTKL